MEPPVIITRSKKSLRKRKASKLSPQVRKVDPFLRLPDDIIVSYILSRLSLKESVATSILSRRWQKLWIHSIGLKLVFSYLQDPYKDLEMVSQRTACALRLKLQNGISHILATYDKPTLDELAIRFHFDSSCSDAIDSWVDCAFRKGVALLELDFTPWSAEDQCIYTFPSIEKLSALHARCDNHLHRPVSCAGMSNLRVVCLKYVNISSEVIDFMLSDCPLERLILWHSMLAKKIRVSAQSSRLKSLEILWCFGTEVTVSSPNLISLCYCGNAEYLHLEHAPLLSELHIGYGYCRYLLKTCCQNFSYISQLKRLTLELQMETISESISYSLEFPKILKLEQLEVKLRLTCLDSCLLWPIMLIKAAPFLHKFSMKLDTSPTWMERNKIAGLDKYRENLRNATKLVNHRCLKLIEMHGFRGHPNELELGHCLLGVSPSSLEKFVVVPRRLHSERVFAEWQVCSSVFCSSVFEEYRKLAKSMSCWVPAGVEFVVS